MLLGASNRTGGIILYKRRLIPAHYIIRQVCRLSKLCAGFSYQIYVLMMEWDWSLMLSV